MTIRHLAAVIPLRMHLWDLFRFKGCLRFVHKLSALTPVHRHNTVVPNQRDTAIARVCWHKVNRAIWISSSCTEGLTFIITTCEGVLYIVHQHDFPANTKHLYNICTTSANVFDVSPTLYKFYTNVLCSLGLMIFISLSLVIDFFKQVRESQGNSYSRISTHPGIFMNIDVIYWQIIVLFPLINLLIPLINLCLILNFDERFSFKYFNHYNAGIDFRRQILTVKVDPRTRVNWYICDDFKVKKPSVYFIQYFSALRVSLSNSGQCHPSVGKAGGGLLDIDDVFLKLYNALLNQGSHSTWKSGKSWKMSFTFSSQRTWEKCLKSG